MVKLLTDLAANALVNNLTILKDKTYMIPLKLLYKLIDVCLTPVKKSMAFTVLIKNWSYQRFCAREINSRLGEEELILIASLIQKRQCGEIKSFELCYNKFQVFGEGVTDAFLKIICNKEQPLLSVHRYHPEKTSRSYADAFDHAKNSLYHSAEFHVAEKTKVLGSTQHYKKSISIAIELVINDGNVSTIKNIFFQQMCGSVSTKIIATSLHFDYVTTKEIAKILQLIDHRQLHGVDLSFNCLSNYDGSRLQLVCKELKNCVGIRRLSIAYNSIDSRQCSIITDCCKMLPNLQYLDLSQNKLGDGLVDLFTMGIKSEFLTTLMLSGCLVSKTVLESLIHCCEKLNNNLQTLKLDQNPAISFSKSTLLSLVLCFKSTLRHLDVSSCSLPPSDIRSLCTQLVEHAKLNVLIVWPNPGLNDEYIRCELLPILKCLPYLHNVPPLKILNTDN